MAPDGSVVTGYPQAIIERGLMKSPMSYTTMGLLVHLRSIFDGSGTLEVIVTGWTRVYIFDHLGQDWGDFPVELCAEELCGISGTRTITSPAIGDVDGDGDIEIGIATNEVITMEADRFLFD